MKEDLYKSISNSARLLINQSSYIKSGYIEIPTRLIDQYENHDEAYRSIVQPQWDHLADSINNGGYLSILAMQKGIKEKRENIEKRKEEAQLEVNRYQMIYNLLRYEAGVHGLDTTFSESLGEDDPKASTPEWWKWGIARISTIFEGQRVEKDYSYYPMVEPVFLSTYAADKAPDFHDSFDHDTTWREAIDEVASDGKTQSLRLDRMRGLLQVATFRESLLSSIIWEYELLGYVHPFEENQSTAHDAPPEENTDEDERLAMRIIKKGCELYDANESGYKNRSALLDALVVEFNYQDRKGVEGPLKRVGYYETKGYRPAQLG